MEPKGLHSVSMDVKKMIDPQRVFRENRSSGLGLAGYEGINGVMIKTHRDMQESLSGPFRKALFFARLLHFFTARVGNENLHNLLA